MDDATLLLRQIHPSFVQGGQVSSQAFTPTPKDQNQLSVYDGDQLSPDKSFEHYTETLGLASAGVLSVTIGECNVLELPVRPDPEPFKEHVVIDFSDLGSSQRKNKAKQLKRKAVIRGWLHQVI